MPLWPSFMMDRNSEQKTTGGWVRLSKLDNCVGGNGTCDQRNKLCRHIITNLVHVRIRKYRLATSSYKVAQHQWWESYCIFLVLVLTIDTPPRIPLPQVCRPSFCTTPPCFTRRVVS